jgi:hypothetical protein
MISIRLIILNILFKPPEIFSPSLLKYRIMKPIIYDWDTQTKIIFLRNDSFNEWLRFLELRAWIDLDNNLYLSQSNFPIILMIRPSSSICIDVMQANKKSTYHHLEYLLIEFNQSQSRWFVKSHLMEIIKPFV